MIELINLSKWYPTPHGRYYVFKNLNFKFPDGVSVALMGRNGAGKSTLFSLIAGLDSPSEGEVRTSNSISWTVGSPKGFQGSLSARDNIRFVCRVYGLSPKETAETIRFVQGFAEIGRFFDMPIKTYSSGMKGRVSFGLSMAFKFDTYLVDEGMAAGDPIFKARATKAFKDRTGESTLLLVSHQPRDVRDLCDVVVLLEGGEAVLYEDVEEGIQVYQNMKSTAIAPKQ
jgi:capsular polysaccharide transport system ATP-binding protein